jgi:gas vesicle protein
MDGSGVPISGNSGSQPITTVCTGSAQALLRLIARPPLQLPFGIALAEPKLDRSGKGLETHFDTPVPSRQKGVLAMANTNKPHDMGSQIREEAGHMAEKAKETGSSMADKAKDIASTVADKAKDVAGAVRDRAASAAEAVGEKADAGAGYVGGGMEHLGRKLHENAPSGFLGDAAHRVASGLESSGRYLREEGLTGIAEDLGDLIKRNPIPAMLVGIGLGFLLARATSRS